MGLAMNSPPPPVPTLILPPSSIPSTWKALSPVHHSSFLQESPLRGRQSRGAPTSWSRPTVDPPFDSAWQAVHPPSTPSPARCASHHQSTLYRTWTSAANSTSSSHPRSFSTSARTQESGHRKTFIGLAHDTVSRQHWNDHIQTPSAGTARHNWRGIDTSIGAQSYASDFETPLGVRVVDRQPVRNRSSDHIPIADDRLRPPLNVPLRKIRSLGTRGPRSPTDRTAIGRAMTVNGVVFVRA